MLRRGQPSIPVLLRGIAATLSQKGVGGIVFCSFNPEKIMYLYPTSVYMIVSRHIHRLGACGNPPGQQDTPPLCPKAIRTIAKLVVHTVTAMRVASYAPYYLRHSYCYSITSRVSCGLPTALLFRTAADSVSCGDGDQDRAHVVKAIRVSRSLEISACECRMPDRRQHSHEGSILRGRWTC